MSEKENIENRVDKKSRRDFMKISVAGAAVAVTRKTALAATNTESLKPRDVQESTATRLDKDTKTIHSVCLACNARCGVRGVVQDGKLVNISGNPFHPYNTQFEPLSTSTPIKDSLKVDSPLCGKSLDTPNHIYSPYRIVKPMKRSGPRGSGKFEEIEWDQMIKEIAEGGALFAHIGEDKEIEGIKDVCTDEPISKEDPELGPKRNGLIFMTGRLQSGRKEIIDRFVKSAAGSKNRIGHTDICGLGFRMGNWAFTDKKQVELKADVKNCDYMLVFGANIYEGLQPGINTYGAMVSKRHGDGKLKFAIADPRATRACAHAQEWLPVKPGKDGALAMGMIRSIIEEKRYNASFLSTPNLNDSRLKGFATVSNATHLVIQNKDHLDYGMFLRMKHIDPSLNKENGDEPVVMTKKGELVKASLVGTAELEVDMDLNDYFGNKIKVKSSFLLLKESAESMSIAEYAKICGVPEKQIKSVAKEFTSHGTRAAVTQYHGAGNYVNGTWAAYAVAMLNAMVGNISMKGGYVNGGGGCGSPKKGLYDLKTFPGIKKPKGVAMSREKSSYEKSVEYQKKKDKTGSGYPSQRPWFPFSKGGLCVECISGIDELYPYPAKIVFTYLFNPVYSIPGGYRYHETFKDQEKVPLHVSFDIAINETNVYADYIVPDISYAEGHYGWLTPHAPAMTFTSVRSPMVEPVTGKTGDGRPFCTETFFIDAAKAAKLPGFGDNAIPDKNGKLHPLNRAEDFFLRAYANICHNAKSPMATPEEKKFVESNYHVAKYKNILTPNEWGQVCHMLARGGVFKTYEDGFKGDFFKKGITHVHVYNEELGTTRNSLTGKRFSGVPGYVVQADSSGEPIDKVDESYPFTIVTYKSRLHTQSRSLWSKLAMEVQSENYVEINTKDAISLNLKKGDRVKVVSRSNPNGIFGAVTPTELVRPGCVAVTFHFGHTQFGGSPIKITKGASPFYGGDKIMKNGETIPEKMFTKGLNMNDVSRLDKGLNNTPMVDLAGGIPDFSSTRVKVIPVA